MKPAIEPELLFQKKVSSMSRLFCVVACLASLVAFSSDSSAAVVVDIREVGGNVVSSTTGGTLNVSGLTFANENPAFGRISNNLLLVGSGMVKIFQGAMTISAPISPGFSLNASINNGPTVGFGIPSGSSTGLLGISSNAVLSSGLYTIEAASSTYNSQTLSSLNLTPGTYTVSWGSNGSSDSIIINIMSSGSSGEVPEPSTAVIAGLLLAGSAWRTRSQRVATRK